MNFVLAKLLILDLFSSEPMMPKYNYMAEIGGVVDGVEGRTEVEKEEDGQKSCRTKVECCKKEAGD